MAEQLNDQVTGAGPGIGRVVALASARVGARAVVSDVAVEGGEETVHIIGDAGEEAVFVETDVSSAKEIEALVGGAAEGYGRLDCAINLTGKFLCIKHEIPRMLETGGGSIVNLASVLGLVGFTSALVYTAAKHGVVGLMKSATLEYSALGVRVNALFPGWIETPMVIERGVEAGTHPVAYWQLAELHPMGLLGKPEEIAEAAVWLSSDALRFVTGYALAADGGQ